MPAADPDHDFHAFATQGTSIAKAHFEPSDLDAIIRQLNERFGLQLAVPENLYTEMIWALRRAAGQFWDSSAPIERTAVRRRLRSLTSSTRLALLILDAHETGPRDEHDGVALRLLTEAAQRASNSSYQHAAVAVRELREAISTLSLYASHAEKALHAKTSKKGKRRLTWYASFVDALLIFASRLEIPLTTAGDRSKNPHETPLTVLAFALERSLPPTARSRTLAACAKRLDDFLPVAKRRPTRK